MTIVEIASISVAVLGIALTTAVAVYYGRENRKLQRERISFTWDELYTGARDLAKKVRGGFVPEIVLAISVRGATVAGIVVLEFDIGLPLFTCIQDDLNARFSFQPFDHTLIQTRKWSIYIPNALRAHADKRILIVDDFAMSGDLLDAVRRQIIEFGFREQSIKAATLVCATDAIGGHKAPEFYWHETPTHRFYFPWGQAR